MIKYSMLTVICGENMSASRQYFQSITEAYKKKNYIVQNITPAQLLDVYKNSAGVISLFGQEKIYVLQKLSGAYSKRSKAEFSNIVDELASDKNYLIFDWEEGKSAFELSALKKIATEMKEFKPEKSIFQLLEACYPGNRNDFVQGLTKVNLSQEDTFIFIMLARHIRSLILAKEDTLGAKVSPWQKKNLMMQAKFWPADKLIGFYEGLGRIDLAIKSGSTPFNLKKSLDILACYYL